jgi:imidazoleglycerol-phosphate dehydratase
LIHDFFLAFTNQLAMNLHFNMTQGRNPHHIIEAGFKAFARAMSSAVQHDPRVQGVLSTKGTL